MYNFDSTALKNAFFQLELFGFLNILVLILLFLFRKFSSYFLGILLFPQLTIISSLVTF